MLALHPEIQDKVVRELKQVYGTADATINYNNLNSLTYLDMVVKETMRLFPVLPISARKVTDEFDIGESSISLPQV
jgi:cytochrome P450